MNISKTAELLAKLRSSIDNIPLSEEEATSFEADIRSAEIQVDGGQPKVGILRECSKSIKATLESAASRTLASQLLQDINSFLSGMPERIEDVPKPVLTEKRMAPEEKRVGPVSRGRLWGLRPWTRISRDETINEEWSSREQGEESASRDLEKPLEQLLSDVHEKYFWIRKETKEEQPLLYMLARVASMMTAVTKSNTRLARWVLALAILQVALTVAHFLR
jgi:hypothetical protein